MPPRPKFDYLTETAYHEAGHAVIAFHSNLPFEVISIVPNLERGSAGHIHSPWPIMERDSNTPPKARCAACGASLSPFELVNAFVKDHDFGDDQDRALRCIRVLLAGREAGRILTGRRCNVSASSDLETVGALIDDSFAYLSERTIKLWIAAICADVGDELLHHWHTVEALAQAVLAHRELSEEAAVAVMLAAKEAQSSPAQREALARQESVIARLSEAGS